MLRVRRDKVNPEIQTHTTHTLRWHFLILFTCVPGRPVKFTSLRWRGWLFSKSWSRWQIALFSCCFSWNWESSTDRMKCTHFLGKSVQRFIKQAILKCFRCDASSIQVNWLIASCEWWMRRGKQRIQIIAEASYFWTNLSQGIELMRRGEKTFTSLDAQDEAVTKRWNIYHCVHKHLRYFSLMCLMNNASLAGEIFTCTRVDVNEMHVSSDTCRWSWSSVYVCESVSLLFTR